MRIAITGASGFIAKNLRLKLSELGYDDIALVSHDISEADLLTNMSGVSVVFHLAGVNRPSHVDEFTSGNVDFTSRICATLNQVSPSATIIYSSSTQADNEGAYGSSKKAAEQVLYNHGKKNGSKVYIYRLPNVFGKWSRPNYNSAVATFCHNTVRDLPIQINDPNAVLNLVHIDDLVDEFIKIFQNVDRPSGLIDVEMVYSTTVGELAEAIRSFKESRETLISPRVGRGFTRALYATYVSYLRPTDFAYHIPVHGDERGIFVEMLKTADSGQFSFFTAHPQITRGEHYHHSKTEKFLVISGTAEFRFRQVETNETHSIVTNGAEPQIVETVPGWTHDITNIGEDILIVMLWANEIFDHQRPDTISMKV